MTREVQYDIVVFGVTGFTGALVAEYLAAQETPNWAIAGRSKAKLGDIQTKLKHIGSQRVIPMILADSDDQASLDAMVLQAKVVISTVGPYAKYGFGLVDACVRLGTDYVDLTGEPQFIREIVEKYHDIALQKGVCIVPSCGFDSIPIADHFKALGLATEHVFMSVWATSGGISGGTIASGANMVETVPTSKLREINENADYLVPNGHRTFKSPFVFYEKHLKAYQTKWIMEAANSRLVHRSNGLLDYGSNFTYNEAMRTKSYLIAVLGSLAHYVIGFLLWFPWTRYLIKKAIPAGTGPSEKTMRDGFFNGRFVGVSTPNANGQVQTAFATISFKGDPGYSVTAKMIAESALCLLQKDSIKPSPAGFPVKRGGVLTSASSMGFALIDRLRKAGFTIELKKTF